MKKHWRLVGVVFLAAVSFSLLGVRLRSADNHSPFPAKVRHGLTFSLYYPSNLPSGYYVDRSSFEQQNGVLIFYIRSPKNQAIGVSEQPVPAGVTLPQASKGPIPIPGEKDFTWAIGRTHIGLEGANYVSETITNNGIWIILNVSGLTADQATSLTESFTASQ